MKSDNKYLGLVTKKFNEFFMVKIEDKNFDGSNKKFLCKVRSQ